MLYFITALLLGIFIILILIYLKNNTTENNKEFTDFDELVRFIQRKFECKLQDQVPLYGFAESSYISTEEMSLGLSDKPVLHITVLLLLENKNIELITAICPQLDAEINKSDFLAILPFYSKQLDTWQYMLIATLLPIYQENGKGFKIKENFARQYKQ